MGGRDQSERLVAIIGIGGRNQPVRASQHSRLPHPQALAHEKLDVRTLDDMQRASADLAGQVDCFFSAHVLACSVEIIPLCGAPAQAGQALRLIHAECS
jgi:hypothetical protein